MKIDYLETAFLERSIAMSNLAMSTTFPSNKNQMKKVYEKQIKCCKGLGSSKIGSGHDNFLNGIIVRFVLTATNKFWTEFQRYHFAEFVTSQSTMHRAKNMDFRIIINEYVTDEIRDIIVRYQKEYNENPTESRYMTLLYNLPSGIEISADIVTNYRQLKTMITQRKDHKLKEWRDFCEYMIEELPMFSELTGFKKQNTGY